MTTPSRVLRSGRSVLLAALFGPLLLLGCKDGASTGQTAKPAEGGASAPAAKTDAKADFQLASIDGRQIGPKSFPGQVVVVDFWATWCMPCRLQAEILEPVYRDYKGRGVQFLATNVGEEPDQVKKFLKDKPFPYPVLLDPKQSTADNLGIVALPTLMVVNKKGEVAYFQSGIADGDTLRDVLKKAGA